MQSINFEATLHCRSARPRQCDLARARQLLQCDLHCLCTRERARNAPGARLRSSSSETCVLQPFSHCHLAAAPGGPREAWRAARRRCDGEPGPVTMLMQARQLRRTRPVSTARAVSRRKSSSVSGGGSRTTVPAALWSGGESWSRRYPRATPPQLLGAAQSVRPVTDSEAGFDIETDEFVRFNQRDDAFCRSWYDASYQKFCGGAARVMSFYDSYRKPLANQWAKRGGGFAQRDFAFRNAAWHIADIFAERREAEGRREGFLDPLTALRDGPEEKCDMGSAVDAATHIKHAARALGADMVGITHADPRWHYSRSFAMAEPDVGKENELPPGCNTVIVVGQSMDSGLIRTYPSALGGAATGMGYAHDVLVLLAVSQ